jgi:hypothetical protein
MAGATSRIVAPARMIEASMRIGILPCLRVALVGGVVPVAMKSAISAIIP